MELLRELVVLHTFGWRLMRQNLVSIKSRRSTTQVATGAQVLFDMKFVLRHSVEMPDTFSVVAPQLHRVTGSMMGLKKLARSSALRPYIGQSILANADWKKDIAVSRSDFLSAIRKGCLEVL
jgi:hypothetical protein